MPLRSVEAATRDDAIAAAREQFGPTARVVGVRRVRSGGVLGFFATERYVAEVAPDPHGRPVVADATGSMIDPPDETPSDFSSPLASAAPARARGAAPARNGAAAWAAEAARTSRDIPVSSPASSPDVPRVAAPLTADVRATAAPRTPSPARTGSQPVVAPEDDDRVSELAGLLAAQPTAPEPSVPSRAAFPRAEFQRAGSPRSRNEDPGPLDIDLSSRNGSAVPAAPASAAPSPFTAALARMVAGDRDVRQAVREALDDPAAPRPRGEGDSRPSRPRASGTADTSVASPATRQKEESVGDQVIAPSTSADQPGEIPARAAAPELPVPSVSSREEAIAEVLRAALAQGHSDEALAGILRKVLAGASPQTALAEPEPAFRAAPEAVLSPDVSEPPAAAQVRAPAPVVAVAPVVEVAEPAAPATVASAPVRPVVEAIPAESGAPAAPSLFPTAVPGYASPAPVSPAPFSYFAAPAPFAPPPLFAPPVGSMWGDPSPAPLWGEPVTRTVSRRTQSDVPIWAGIASPEAAAAIDLALRTEPAPVGADDVPAEDASAPDEQAADAAAATEAPSSEIPVEIVVEIVAETGDEPLTESPAADAPAELVVETRGETLFEAQVDAEQADEARAAAGEDLLAENQVEEALETEIAGLAPMLARTASDPAPMMSLDSTTVMPPLSLLPPLPSSRGRGRPPVPPASQRLVSRAATPAVTSPAPATPDQQVSAAPDGESAAAPVPVASATRSWATVTRLPVAPLMATPETPEVPDLLEADEVEEPVGAPIAAPEWTPTREFPEIEQDVILEPAPSVAPTSAVQLPSGDLRSRLEALGVPGHLLGATFDDDVAGEGTYAALTRALAQQLPATPQLPNGAGEVLFVVGPGFETLRAARSLAASLRLDPDSVQWATRGELAGLAPKGSRVTTVDTAMDRRQHAAESGTVTIVAVDAPMRIDAYWMSQMLAIWTPAAVWVVVEATRKPEDLEPWIDGLPRVDALIVTDTDLSADPAAVLRRVPAPVALLDGIRATPHRWASLLCERLESTKE